MKKIENIIKFMIDAHGDQKYGNLPFCVHPLLVSRHFEDNTLKTVALLHDVIEDTPYSFEDIRNLFGEEIAIAVDAISRRDDEKYLEDYIPRVAKNALAKQVKIADLQENIHSAKFCYLGYEKLIPRYEKALRILQS